MRLWPLPSRGWGEAWKQPSEGQQLTWNKKTTRRGSSLAWGQSWANRMLVILAQEAGDFPRAGSHQVLVRARGLRRQ